MQLYAKSITWSESKKLMEKQWETGAFNFSTANG
jgi:hypothetical protein